MLRKALFGVLFFALAACSSGNHRGIHLHLGKIAMRGHVVLWHFRHHRLLGKRDLGYGTITNLATDSMAYDGSWWTTSNVPNNTLTTEKDCATGTGTTAAAATE